jgi:hypothetical protein
MKIKDVERINALLKAHGTVQELIGRTERADAEDFSLMVERGGDGSIRMSLEGADSTHYQGHAVSGAFLERLKMLSLEELRTRLDAIAAELVALGVEIEE